MKIITGILKSYYAFESRLLFLPKPIYLYSWYIIITIILVIITIVIVIIIII